MFTKWPSFQCQTEFGVWRESEGLRKKVEKELEEYLKSYREKFLLYLDTDWTVFEYEAYEKVFEIMSSFWRTLEERTDSMTGGGSV